MKKIVFLYQKKLPFIVTDISILKENYCIKEVEFNSLYKIFFLIKEIFSSQLVYIWFAKLHAFLAVVIAKIFLKPTIIVAGGDDVAYLPQYQYGIYSFWWKKWCPTLTFKLADVVICVSKFNKKEAIINAKVNPRKIFLIPHGFDFKEFHPDREKRKDLVLTVSRINSETIRIKAILEIIKSAYILKDKEFLIIGKANRKSIQYLKRIKPSNLKFIQEVPQKELISYYQKAFIYLQPSRYESFCCALAESMLCNCIPVVSRRGALPEVAGDKGYFIQNINEEEIIKRIQNIDSLNPFNCRERIIEKFSLDAKRKRLLNLVRGLM
jgi:glycosyltransferase involved in cell wall biosynthesis